MIFFIFYNKNYKKLKLLYSYIQYKNITRREILMNNRLLQKIAKDFNIQNNNKINNDSKTRNDFNTERNFILNRNRIYTNIVNEYVNTGRIINRHFEESLSDMNLRKDDIMMLLEDVYYAINILEEDFKKLQKLKYKISSDLPEIKAMIDSRAL